MTLKQKSTKQLNNMTPEELLRRHAIDFQKWLRQNEYWEATSSSYGKSNKWGRLSNMIQFWTIEQLYDKFIADIHKQPERTSE